MLRLSNDTSAALIELANVRAQRNHYTAIALGDEAAAALAELRVDALGLVVLMPDPTIVQGVAGLEELATAHEKGAALAFLNNAFKLITTLSALAAMSPTAIEEAFIAAEEAAE